MPAQGRVGSLEPEIGLERNAVAFLACVSLRPGLDGLFSDCRVQLVDGAPYRVHRLDPVGLAQRRQLAVGPRLMSRPFRGVVAVVHVVDEGIVFTLGCPASACVLNDDGIATLSG